ncbi:MAG: carboxylating nicotinate-nucleotide diphosphorylase [Bacteroidetes bacterium]|nr:MAG: carboxylating nicotinate-nucleotide diphosphorylase [Bacteroidota bacterium]
MEADQLKNFIAQALAEDIGNGDHTSCACIPEDSRSTAELLIKDIGVVAGVEVAAEIFKYLDPEAAMHVRINDGADVTHGNVAFTVECNTRSLLAAERIVLNTMQRMSGIATLSSRFAVEVEGMDVKVLDTRKTTPLFRFLEKEAVRIGGCENYRFGLFDWVMIKDNHIDACGGIQQAIDSIHTYFEEKNLSLGITIEVRNLVELYEVLRRGGVDRIMLDNFDLPIMEEAVKIIDGAFETEASGGITLGSVRMIAETGVNYISVGALTHSAGSLDMSLNIVNPD